MALLPRQLNQPDSLEFQLETETQVEWQAVGQRLQEVWIVLSHDQFANLHQ
ncbi:MAG: hypothetical protein ACRD2L_19870 [Terriglobia bacterium]